MTIYTDNVSVGVLIGLFPFLASAGRIELCCVNSPAQYVQTCLTVLGWFFRTRIIVTRIFFEIGGLRHENGQSLRYVVDEDVCRTIIEHEKRLLRQPDPILKHLPSNWPKIWVVRCISHILNDEVRPLLRALYIIQAHIQCKAPDRGIVLVNWSPWLSSERYAEFCGNLEIRTCGTVLHLFFRVLKAGILFLGFIMHGLWGMLFRSKRTKGESEQRLVAAQYCWGHDLNDRSDVYWLRGGHVRPNQALLYFNRPDTPLTLELAEELSRQGLQRVVCPKGRLSGHALVSRLRRMFRRCGEGMSGRFDWYPSKAWGRELAGRLVRLVVPILHSLISRRVSLGQSLDIACSAMMLTSEVNYWKHFFSDNGVLMHTNHSGDTGWMHTAQTLALEEIGGVNFRSNYSYVHGVDVNYAREFQFYFAWGIAPRCRESLEQFYCSHLFVSGYPFDHMFRRASDPVSEPGAKTFRLTVFDESCGPYASFSSGIIRDFYALVLDIAKDNPDIEIRIKPKIYFEEEILRYCPAFRKALDSELVTLLSPQTRPCEAAVGSDLVMCLGHNSAGVEAALTGRRVVCWIHDGHICPQLDYADSMINFHSRKEIRDAVRAFASGSRDAEKMGNFSSVIDQIDPFRDGKAAERVGTVLAQWLDEVSRTGSSDAAARKSVEVYRKKFGGAFVRSSDVSS